MDLAVADTYAQKRELDQLVSIRKGKKRAQYAECRKTRKGMLANFTASFAASRKNLVSARQAVIAEAYAPCVLPLASLDKMYIQNLLLETHHRGSVLVVRTFGHSFQDSSMQICTTVEDEIGEVEQLNIYHFNFARWPDKELRSGTVLAIKDPYYRSVITNGGLCLSVFHPSDVVFLEQDHPLFPEKWKTVQPVRTALQWKEEGNKALKKENYQVANHCYEKALGSANSDDDLKHDIHRNKALVEIYLGQYDAARADAIASLLDSCDEKSKALDTKALYRAGRALYELSDYQGAREMYQRALQLSPSDGHSREQLKRTVARLEEEQEGSFDFETMSERITATKNFRAEQTSFLRRTEVRQTQHRGRGLFATESITCGDIILCEKAFVSANLSKDALEQIFIVNPSSRRPLSGGHMSAWFLAVEKVYNNPSLAHRLLDLHDDYGLSYNDHATEPLTKLPVVDGAPVVDIFRIMNIFETNAFEFMALQDRELPYPNIPNPELGVFHDSAGLWSRMSYANHACMPNAQRSFLGDFMLVRANKDIPKDTEIEISYAPADGKYEYQKMELRNWGFKCDCKLCIAEETWGGTRSPFIPGADSFEAAEPPIDLYNRSVGRMELINQVKLYVEKLEETYPEQFFAHLPHIGLAKRHGWLTKAYMAESRSLMYAQSVVRDHGFRVATCEPDLRFDRSEIIMTTELVDAFVCMSFWYRDHGKPALSRKMKELALQCYVIMNGADTGFDLLVGFLEMCKKRA